MLKQPLAALFPRIFSGSIAGRSSNNIRPFGSRHNSYSLKSKSKPRTGNSTKIESVTNYGQTTTTDYDQWALEDGTIVSSSIGTEEKERDSSEEKIEPGKVKPVAEGNAIMMTKDVDVDVETQVPLAEEDDGKPLPPVKDFPGIRDPRIYHG